MTVAVVGPSELGDGHAEEQTVMAGAVLRVELPVLFSWSKKQCCGSRCSGGTAVAVHEVGVELVIGVLRVLGVVLVVEAVGVAVASTVVALRVVGVVLAVEVVGTVAARW